MEQEELKVEVPPTACISIRGGEEGLDVENDNEGDGKEESNLKGGEDLKDKKEEF